jgi:UDP-N-acetylmuramyl pentapeptide phosphotransferase/UDP-N-acetylglucosamine-1-phosphate transferase
MNNPPISGGYNAVVHDFQAISILGSGVIALGVAWMLAAGHLPAPVAKPNARSLHAHPVPRTGGVAIWTGWLVAWAAVPVSWHWVAPFALVMSVSLIDDVLPLSAAVRLVTHAVAALAGAALFLDAGWALLAFDSLVIVWMANLYNFMDGADGLAGSMGLFGFGAYAAAAALAQRPEVAVLCAALALACAGFLVFNLPPARLFMGDVGAVTLGFLAGLFGLEGISEEIWPWWFPPLVFGPFILDATVTLLRRIRRGAPLASAHRDHFYQRAILIDGAHGRTVLTYVGWMAGCVILALAGLRWAPDLGGLLLVVAAAGFGWCCRAIDQRWAAWSEVHHAV